MTAVRTLAFGDLEMGAWGVAWIPDGVATTGIALGAGQAASAVPATLAEDAGAHGWKLQAGATQLMVTASTELVPIASADAQAAGFDQLCRVTGRLELNGAEREVDCLGWRTARTLAVEGDRLESFRQVGAWFEPDDGLTLLALRPRRSRGQDSDQIAAGLLEPARSGSISDLRLSTTYRADGRPARAGVEVWIAADGTSTTAADGETASASGDDRTEHSVQEYSRRLAGEALGPYVDWSVGDFELHAAPFRWHSRGLDGPGVYLLGARR